MNIEMRKFRVVAAIGLALGTGLMLTASIVLPLTQFRPRAVIDHAVAASTAEGGHEAPRAGVSGAAHGVDHAPVADPAIEGAPQGAGPENSITVPLERLQSIGVRFEPAKPRRVERTIRTVGRVEVDERRLTRVNVKFEGWIDRLMVDYTGAAVRKGQILFTVYSPELVATQQEYLLAFEAQSRLGSSEFPEVVGFSQALLDAARQRLRFWDIEESHIRDLERTGTILKTLPIHSPGSGTVISKTAVAGMQVKPGDELYTIADLSRLWLHADIFEYELPLIALGQTAAVSASHLSDASLRAVAQFIYPTIDPETRTATVRFELDNPSGRLKPGMFMNLEIKVPLGTRLVVPKDAVLESGERQLIFVHHGGGRLEWRRVTLGIRGDDWIEILDGVQVGDHVITSPNFLLDSESQLKAAMGGMKH
ncbi:MAG: cebB [Microvirga sp.]|jgi:Cu(I)/Ag(I) efflux system membrane fusion protein|nr:cebB [Microvirga sp.]